MGPQRDRRYRRWFGGRDVPSLQPQQPAKLEAKLHPYM